MESFDQFYRFYRKKLFGYLIKKTGDYYLSTDIMQESFTRLLHTYGPKEQNGSLLFTIARNLFLDHVKESKRNEPLQKEHIEISKNPEKEFFIRDSYLRMLAALEKLDEDERDILLLAVTSNLSYHEIGKITGISIANVKIRIHRARVKLKRIFKEEDQNGISN